MRWTAPAHAIWVPKCEGHQAFTSKMGPSVMQINTIGLGLAKSIFQVYGVDAIGQVMISKSLPRPQLLPFLTQLHPCLVRIDACGTSHHRARELIKLGHEGAPDAACIAPTGKPRWVTAHTRLEHRPQSNSDPPHGRAQDSIAL
jgi:hypothetical protein